MSALYEIPLQTLAGTATTLGAYRGKVLLLVNVASACGLTPQYAGLQALYEQYRAQGFEVLGFPCNDFGAQEPGTPEEIQAFCEAQFKVQFPLFAKLSVQAQTRHPLYRQLIAAQPQAQFKPGSDFREKLAGYGIRQAHPEDVLWNFEKFLLSRSGAVVARFAPDTAADEPLLVQRIEAELARS